MAQDEQELGAALLAIVGNAGVATNPDGSLRRTDADAIARRLDALSAWEGEADGSVIYARRRVRAYEVVAPSRYRIQLQRGQFLIETVPEPSEATGTRERCFPTVDEIARTIFGAEPRAQGTNPVRFEELLQDAQDEYIAAARAVDRLYRERFCSVIAAAPALPRRGPGALGWTLAGFYLWRGDYSMATKEGGSVPDMWDAYMWPSAEEAALGRAALGAEWASAKVLEAWKNYDGTSWQGIDLNDPRPRTERPM